MSKKTVFNFQRDASQIALEDLGFDRVQEYAERLSDEQLVNYIMAEAERFRQSRLKDVSLSTRFVIKPLNALCQNKSLELRRKGALNLYL